MTPRDIHQAVRDFFRVIDPLEAFEDREEALRLALDRLALAFHFSEAPYDETEYPDPPRGAYQAIRERIGPLFPHLGLYNAALNIVEEVGTSELGVEDAIDDLADIALDLGDVLHRWEHTSEADALWHFRFGFMSHWGKHLRSLQLYLHTRAF
jgi:hypothetical protein